MDESSYSGNDTYKIVDKLVKDNSGELLIITPYIDLFYAKMLIKESGRKKVAILTSGSPVNRDAIKELSSLNPYRFLKPISYFSVLSIILIYLKFYPFAIAAAVIGTANFAYMVRKRGFERRNLRLKVAKGKFFHEKIYVTNNASITGSTNLTFRGTHRNIEHVEYTEDETKTRNLREHFKSVWNSS